MQQFTSPDAASRGLKAENSAQQAAMNKIAAKEAEVRIQERERRIFTATQLLGDTLAGTTIGHGIGWLSLLSSLGVTGYGIYTMEDVALERRGFLGMGLLFITSSVFTLSKTLRDAAEAEKLLMLQNEVAQVCNEMATRLQPSSVDKELRGAVESLRGGGYWFLQSVGALLSSIAMTLYGLSQMPVSADHRKFTTLGIGFVVSSCFFVSNQARDSREAKKWLNMLADDIAESQEDVDNRKQKARALRKASKNKGSSDGNLSGLRRHPLSTNGRHPAE